MVVGKWCFYEQDKRESDEHHPLIEIGHPVKQHLIVASVHRHIQIIPTFHKDHTPMLRHLKGYFVPG